MKALVGAFNQEKALVGAFSVIVKTGCVTDGLFYSTSHECHVSRGRINGSSLGDNFIQLRLVSLCCLVTDSTLAFCPSASEVR